jgi:hypothetical protein
MRAATDPSTDHLMTFAMRYTLALAVVSIVGRSCSSGGVRGL